MKIPAKVKIPKVPEWIKAVIGIVIGAGLFGLGLIVLTLLVGGIAFLFS